MNMRNIDKVDSLKIVQAQTEPVAPEPFAGFFVDKQNYEPTPEEAFIASVNS